MVFLFWNDLGLELTVIVPEGLDLGLFLDKGATDSFCSLSRINDDVCPLLLLEINFIHN